MDKMNDVLLAKITAKISSDAKSAKDDAAWGGRMDDGGSRSMLSSLKKYTDGYYKRIPDSWGDYVKQIKKEDDPEYQDFLRLKKKFKD